MSQHDMVLDNAPGVDFLADLNAALAALVSLNAGPTEPAKKYPGMFWLDTSVTPDGALKMRNPANTGWGQLQLSDAPVVTSGVSAGTVMTAGNQVSNVANSALTTFPVSTILCVRATALSARTTPLTVRLHASITSEYDLAGTGTALAGTWRVAGGITIPTGPVYYQLMGRTG